MVSKQVASIAMVIVAIAVAVSITVFFSGQKPLVVENVVIDSGEEDPFESFSYFSSNSPIVVSPQMNEAAQQVDYEIFNGTALFLQVLQGNSKNPVQVIRVYDSEENLAYCLSNFGDFNRSERLELQDCLDFISPESNAVVLLQFPDEGLDMPRLEIGDNQLVVRPSSNDDVSKACFLALRIMFSNSQEIVDRSNTLLSGLQS